MKKEVSYLNELSSRGFRLSKVRRAIAQTLEQHCFPITVPELSQALRKKGINPNKTSLYREFDLLMYQKLVREVILIDGKRPFLGQVGAHCHFVCKNRQSVTQVLISRALKNFQSKISRWIGKSINSARILGGYSVLSKA